jgi:hypothetical protein
MNALKSNLPWTAYIDGDDVVLIDVIATCFGGDYDAGDNGLTESGARTKGNPSIMGIALPVRSTEAATRISPLADPNKPHIPWFSKCRVWRKWEGESLGCDAEVIDNGPDELHFPTHAFDVTPAVAHHFTPGMPLASLPNDWEANGMCLRIFGAAKYVV